MGRAWGFWTRYKLELLERYLDAFTTATKFKARRSIYLDLFGGEPENEDRLTHHPIDGSARIALNTDDPPFDHLRFFELEPNASKLRETLEREYPERDWKVYAGDSNERIHDALAELHQAGIAWAPTFAFIDPNGPHYTWRTLQALAGHKGRDANFKVELWMLFPDALFARLLPVSGELRDVDNAAITAMFGTPHWHSIWRAKLAGEITPTEAREEYVNLMRWRLEQQLGYRWTHELEIRNEGDRPIYRMIFATDNEAGHKIMTSLYNRAAEEFPAMAEEARATRHRMEMEEQGQGDLFTALGIDVPAPVAKISRGTEQLYFHESPEEPREHDPVTCRYC